MVSWDAVDQATGYHVSRVAHYLLSNYDSSQWDLLFEMTEVQVEHSPYLITGLVNGFSYLIRVSAFNEYSEGLPAFVDATPRVTAVTPPSDPAPPAQPPPPAPLPPPTEPPPLPAPAVKQISLVGTITERLRSWYTYLGEIRNTGTVAACFIKIVLDFKAADGTLIDTDYTYIDGSTLLVGSGIDTDTCLRPGETGAFEVLTTLTQRPASFSSLINADFGPVTEPAIAPSELVIDGTISEGVSYFGNRTYMGMIKNIHPSRIASFVKIHFAAKQAGALIDLDYSYVNGSSCEVIPGLTTETCIAPGESRSFEVEMSEPPENITSYTYSIAYDVVD